MAGRNEYDTMLEVLRSNEEGRLPLIIGGLRTLDLDFEVPTLTENQTNKFAEAVRDNDHVQHLRFYGRFSSFYLMTRILEVALPNHPRIQTLQITGDIGPDTDMAFIPNMLRTNTTLTKLHLDYCYINPKIVKVLVEGLKHNKTLQEFFITHQIPSVLGFQGIRTIASFLANEHCCLRKLRCPLDDAGAKVLVEEGLAKNKSLIGLILIIYQSDQLTDIGCRYIEATLRHVNYTLESVDWNLPHRSRASANHIHRINVLCETNYRLKEEIKQFNDYGLAGRIPPGLWPHTLHHFQSKPDLIYALLKSKPDICQEPSNIRRRGRDDRGKECSVFVDNVDNPRFLHPVSESKMTAHRHAVDSKTRESILRHSSCPRKAVTAGGGGDGFDGDFDFFCFFLFGLVASLSSSCEASLLLVLLLAGNDDFCDDDCGVRPAAVAARRSKRKLRW